MRLFAFVAVFLLLHIPATASAADDRKAKLPLPESEALVMGQTYKLKSDILGMDRRLTVRLPTGYADKPDTKYDVVYVIDGGPEQDFPHIAGIAQSSDMNGTFAPFILIGVETVNRRSEISPPVADPAVYITELRAKPGGSPIFRKFLADEVKPWVETHFRTSGNDAVLGESLAGLFIIETLFEMPDLFDDYIAVTPSLWWENMKYGREAKAYLSILPAGDRRLYVALADEGFRHKEGTDLLIAALEEAAPENLKWLYVPQSKTETHASIYHGAALDAFRAFYGLHTRTGRPGSLLSGKPIPPRTAKQQARLDAPCTAENTRQTTPEETTLDSNPLAYECILYDYGPRAKAGNFHK
ncbi:MAG: alpha/beta hydrolase-fold protein [Sphingorhabdus sp.]